MKHLLGGDEAGYGINGIDILPLKEYCSIYIGSYHRCNTYNLLL